jgi:hypothetical protein
MKKMYFWPKKAIVEKKNVIISKKRLTKQNMADTKLPDDEARIIKNLRIAQGIARR